MKNFCIIVINLKRAIARKIEIQNQLNAQNISGGGYESIVKFLDAYDKNLLTPSIVDNLCDFSKVPKRSYGEIACAQSHRLAYQLMIENNIKNAVILEDDIILSSDFIEVVNHLCEVTKKMKNFVIKLDPSYKPTIPCNVWANKKIGFKNYSIKIPLVRPLWTWGYFIDINAANTLLKAFPKIKYVADEWFEFSKFIKLYQLIPSIVDENLKYSSSSIIGAERGDQDSEQSKKFLSTNMIFCFIAKCFRFIKRIVDKFKISFIY